MNKDYNNYFGMVICLSIVAVFYLLYLINPLPIYLIGFSIMIFPFWVFAISYLFGGEE